MGFTMIAPEAKTKPGQVTISCSAARNGADPKLMVSIPSAVWGVVFGADEKCNVMVGAGADEGKLLIAKVGDTGHFKPTFFRSHVLVRLPRLDWMPDFPMKSIECENRQRPEGLVITMPEWAWSRERQTAIKKAKQQVAREQEAQARGGVAR